MAHWFGYGRKCQQSGSPSAPQRRRDALATAPCQPLARLTQRRVQRSLGRILARGGDPVPAPPAGPAPTTGHRTLAAITSLLAALASPGSSSHPHACAEATASCRSCCHLARFLPSFCPPSLETPACLPSQTLCKTMTDTQKEA